MKYILACIALAGAAQAMAQEPEARVVIPSEGQGTITFFERPNFEGAAITFRRTENNVRVPFLVRSIRAEGEWRVCSSSNLSGRCLIAENNYRDSQRQLGIMLTIGSVEARSRDSYAGWGQQTGGVADAWSGPVGGPSLRGMSVQFFVAPEFNRMRVESCAGGSSYTGCAAQTANRLCNYAGWQFSSSFGEQRLGRRSYLVDVVCANR